MSTATLDTTAVRRWKRYPEYRASGLDWCAQVPAHWEVIRVQHCCNPLVGFPFPSEGFLHEPKGIPLVRGDNVTTGSLRWGDKARYWDHSDGSFTKYLLRTGDVVIGMDGSKVGRNYALIRKTDLPLLLLQRVARLRPHDDLSPEYLFYSIANGRFHTHVDSVRTDPAIPHITLKDILLYPVAVPPLGEQRAIAAFLDRETARIDALIARKERLIELLEEKRQAVISHAVTRGLDPNAPMKDSGVPWLGKVPRNWKLLPIGWLAEVSNGATPSQSRLEYWEDGDIPWVASGEVNEEIVTTPTALITSQAAKDTGLRVIPKGSILLGMIGQGRTRGMSTILDIDACINQNVAAITPRSVLNGEYLRYSLLHAYEPIRQVGRGGQQGALNCELIRDIVTVHGVVGPRFSGPFGPVACAVASRGGVP